MLSIFFFSVECFLIPDLQALLNNYSPIVMKLYCHYWSDMRTLCHACHFLVGVGHLRVSSHEEHFILMAEADLNNRECIFFLFFLYLHLSTGQSQSSQLKVEFPVLILFGVSLFNFQINQQYFLFPNLTF